MRNVAGHHHHRDSAPAERVLDRDPQHPRHLLGPADQLAVVTALGEQLLGMRLLEEPGPDLAARDVGGKRQHRRAAAVGVIQALDEMRVARAGAPGAHREPPGELRLRPGRKRGRLLVVDMDPLDAVGATHHVHDRVEAVAHEPVDPFHAGLLDDLDELLGHGARASRHGHPRQLTGKRGSRGADVRLDSLR